MTSRNAALTNRWMFGTLRNDCLSTHRPGVLPCEIVADALIHPDVGAAEPVDRLLRIADDEQRAGTDRSRRPASSPASSSSSSACNGIGVLELVDQDELKALLKRDADRRAIAHQIACANQEVEKVERAGPVLAVFVASDAILQLGVDERGEVGVRDVAEGLATRRRAALALVAATACRVTASSSTSRRCPCACSRGRDREPASVSSASSPS